MSLLLSVMLVCGQLLWAAEEPVATSLTVQIENVRSEHGQLFVFIYNYENQYPDNPFRWYKFAKSETRKGAQFSLVLDGLQNGKYALVLLDDENSNGTLDKFLGMPREGYAFSNNVRPGFLKFPKYEKLLFDLDREKKILKLDMRYLL